LNSRDEVTGRLREYRGRSNFIIGAIPTKIYVKMSMEYNAHN
jgi:hypothetical protein